MSGAHYGLLTMLRTVRWQLLVQLHPFPFNPNPPGERGTRDSDEQPRPSNSVFHLYPIGNPGIFYDPYSFRFTSRCSRAPTRKRTAPPPPPPPGFNFYCDILNLYNIVIPIINSVNLKKAGMASRSVVLISFAVVGTSRSILVLTGILAG